MTDILFVVGRILYGGFLLMQGLRLAKMSGQIALKLKIKRLPFARPIAVLAGVALSLAGIGILTGLHASLSLTLAIAVLLFVSLMTHDYWNLSEPREISQEMAHFMRNMALIGAALMMFSVLQPWSYSL